MAQILRDGTKCGLGGAVRYGVRFELDGTGRSAVQVFWRCTVSDPYFPPRVARGLRPHIWAHARTIIAILRRAQMEKSIRAKLLNESACFQT